MTVAYFDCFSGISGDMILGALVDAGVPFEELKQALSQLPVDGYAISSKHVSRCGIGATQVQVELLEHGHSHSHGPAHSHANEPKHVHDHGHHNYPDAPASGQSDGPAAPALHHHHHDDDHTHDHVHDSPDHLHGHHADTHGSHDHSHHDHYHSHAHGDDAGHHHHHHGPHRGFSQIRKIIEDSTFSDFVKNNAVEAFRRIAVEEAAVHESTIEEVHFHEVGAVDAIVDIVGAMWCIERLGITRVLASPVAVGSGTVRAAHGVMPVPAPATARLLKGKPIFTGPVGGELATPTGAAIIVTLAESFGPLDNFLIDRVAYGAGSRTYEDNPNYLRVFIGQEQPQAQSAPGESLPLLRENLVVLAAEIDDMPGELLGAAMESLLANGALDCHFVPVQMKKNRPAVTLQVLANPQQVDPLMEIIFRQTSTLGLKIFPCERVSLPRRFSTVQTPFGDVQTKQGLWKDQVLRSVPEYEDCVALAKQKCKTVMEVYSAALSAANAEAGSDASPSPRKESKV